ncbi:MAG TPA: tyrosine-type recombinase/integrase [Urbifossiella sp.]|nr:tyrosine-type recombinase/integrase [Urbifossiella sp.]
MPRQSAVPKYRLHKPTGQAVVTVRNPDGTRSDHYLGKHNSPESRSEYARIVGNIGKNGYIPPADAQHVTIDEVMLAFIRFAEKYYRHADGTPTGELDEFKRSLATIRPKYGHTVAASFGPLALEEVRNGMVAAGWSRKVINRRVGRIKRMFKWAASRQLIRAEVYGALKLLDGLKAGRSDARETDPVKPVDPALVDATLPHLGRHLRAMVELQRHTGMRPGEVVMVHLADIDRTGAVWSFRPRHHKMAHTGRERVILIGPKGQAIINEFIAEGRVVDPTAPLFSPRRAREERFDAMRANRKTRVQPSQADRRKKNPKLQPAEAYTAHTYAHAIRVAAQKAFPLPKPMARRDGESWSDWRQRLKMKHAAAVKEWLGVHHWHPNQLRHLFGTIVRESHGLEPVQYLLGHASAKTSEIYAEKNAKLAASVAAAVG